MKRKVSLLFVDRSNSHSSILPPEVMRETLDSLKLLFPETDKPVARWIRKRRRKGNIPDTALGKRGKLRAINRRIESFHIWRERLIDLKVEFDETRPSTIPQFWADKRNGVQWYTFWVAVLVLILTVVFGLTQCIEGGLQAYKAYHPTIAESGRPRRGR
jgi:hypothetical protein